MANTSGKTVWVDDKLVAHIDKRRRPGESRNNCLRRLLKLRPGRGKGRPANGKGDTQ